MEAGLRVLHRLISIADEPTDDDDFRLRKRVSVVAGYVIGLGALMLPGMSQGLALGWAMALTMAPVCALNLVILARTKRFERYAVVLILVLTLFPAFVDLALGGMVASSGGYVFAFAAPLFAILALGPGRAVAWLLLYLVVLLGLILVDPIISRAIDLQPYPLRLIFFASNFSVPLIIIFFLLRYSDLRRREAQALADDLLTNAIPSSIAARLKRGELRIAEVYPETTVLFADLVAVGAQHLEATLRRVRHRGRGLEVALGEMLEQLQRRRARAVGRARVLRENRSGGQQRRHQQEPHAAARSAPSPAS